jgi:hypothetical protein
MEFTDLVQGPGERHIIYGGTRTGKSSYMDWSIRHIQQTRPEAMILIADTKPRFRAEVQTAGPNNRFRRNAEKLYEGWAKGPMLPNSVAIDMDSPHPFRGLWNDKHPGEAAIMQSDDPLRWKQMVSLMQHFTAKKTSKERLLVVDEGMDFYQRNSLGIDSRNDVILRAARAGGERNIGLMFGAHRPHGIPPLLNTLSSRVSLFYIRYARDMKYLWEMGIPENEFPPDGNYIFKQYTIMPGGIVSDPAKARLALPDSYLQQLSST